MAIHARAKILQRVIVSPKSIFRNFRISPRVYAIHIGPDYEIVSDLTHEWAVAPRKKISTRNTVPPKHNIFRDGLVLRFGG